MNFHPTSSLIFQSKHGVLNKTYDESLIKYLPVELEPGTLKTTFKVYTKTKEFVAYGEIVFEIVNRRISRKKIQHGKKGSIKNY